MHLILAPSNLGLSPLHEGHIPGTWRAPGALMKAGLAEAVHPDRIFQLRRPDYLPEPQGNTLIRNAAEIRHYGLEIAKQVAASCRTGSFVLLVGGDCSLLLGALAGARRSGPLSLVHIDGHSDFRHPGNYNAETVPSGVAGMDLALAVGRGEEQLTRWPGVSGPLVEERNVLQIGERESRDADFAWPDIAASEITQVDIFEALQIGVEGVEARVASLMRQRPENGIWVHLDVDVLDQSLMPAVDCPGSPGLRPDWVVRILSPLVASPRCKGMSLTIYDPDRDPDGACAALILAMLRQLPFHSRSRNTA